LANFNDFLQIRYKVANKLHHLNSSPTYLKPNLDLLGESTLREDCLDLWHNSRTDHTTLIPDVVVLFTDTCDEGKVLWKISGQDAGDALMVQVLCRFKIWNKCEVSILIT
jgi:hypothetical protein